MASLEPVNPPHVLTIAGSDSGGGAGIQADLKTAAAFGCYGSSVITALTAQNTLGVQGVHVVPPEFVVEQLKSIFADRLQPTAAKFGMLATPATISALATYLSTLSPSERPFLVLDPVMISTSGHTLLSEGRSALLRELLPFVDLVTPNIPECGVLLGTSPTSASGACSSLPSIKSVNDIVALAQALHPQLGGAALLLKGGHLCVPRSEVEGYLKTSGHKALWAEQRVEVVEDYRSTLGLEDQSDMVVVDVLLDDGITLFVGQCVDTKSTHGTGCTLSAALASCYALEVTAKAKEVNSHADKETAKQNGEQNGSDGSGPNSITAHKKISHDAVRRAIMYTQAAIASAPDLGDGNGPLNHGVRSGTRLIPPPTKHNPAPFTSYLIANSPEWDAYVRHPFVEALGNGTLPRPAFQHYIAQDYHYLRHYARAHAVGSWKANEFAEIKAFAEITLHVTRESSMHVEFCESFGITLADLQSLPESAAAAAYGRYVVDVATQGDTLDVLVAVLSCLIGYGEVALWLRDRVAQGKAKLEGNPYRRWMEDYAGDEFIGAVRRGIATLEERVAREQPGPEKIARLTKIFADCTRLERDFWQMGLDQSW